MNLEGEKPISGLRGGNGGLTTGGGKLVCLRSSFQTQEGRQVSGSLGSERGPPFTSASRRKGSVRC